MGMVAAGYTALSQVYTQLVFPTSSGTTLSQDGSSSLASLGYQSGRTGQWGYFQTPIVPIGATGGSLEVDFIAQLDTSAASADTPAAATVSVTNCGVYAAPSGTLQ